MRRLISLLALLFVIVAVSSAPAQNPDIFVTPIPANPFTGTVNVERSFVQKDGGTTKFKTVREIGRDSRGRIFNQMRTLVPASSNESPEVVGVHIYDPETRVNIMVNDRQHTFRKGTVNRPPEAVPPSFLSASSGLNTLPQNQFTKEEDLGNKVIEGLSVHGVRQSQTIPDANGGKSVVITDEYWYSEDLRINLELKHNDPRTGGVIMTVTGIRRSEPDPARFEIPAGYNPAGVAQNE
jgi:putative hemolysin